MLGAQWPPVQASGTEGSTAEQPSLTELNNGLGERDDSKGRAGIEVAHSLGLQRILAGDPASIAVLHREEQRERNHQCQLGRKVVAMAAQHGERWYLKKVEMSESASWHKVDHGCVVDTELGSYDQPKGQRVGVHHHWNIAAEGRGGRGG